MTDGTREDPHVNTGPVRPDMERGVCWSRRPERGRPVFGERTDPCVYKEEDRKTPS